ncbi:MAG: phosphoenolpyruvate carboxykinase (GTP) [Clostridiales bacterium]|nr:phosphoenolpyruvate carboxykinase (GTP) [Clostridiales bacterium]
MKTTNRALQQWLAYCADLMKPDEVVWIDGTEAQLEQLRAEGMSTGEMIKLNQELLPGCYYHHSHPNDVARVEGRTYICCEQQEDAGPTNNWMSPEEARTRVLPLFEGCMAGRRMYVIPYSMGPVGSPLSKIGVEVTDSIYVVLSMAIMTRVGDRVLEVLGENGEFVKGLHSKAQLSEEDRYILHFPQSKEIWSVNSGYGGNALLGKKCFSLRIASTIGREEGWMAEHMLILGVEYPNGEVRYVAAAFPSACGKTNLAMLVPPEGYRQKGFKVWCVGDDIAWIRPGEDGRLYAMNPENGFFGVAPGTSDKTNPNAMASTRRNTIFTNVVRNLDNNTVWWEGMDKNPPENAVDWLGNPWNGKTATVKGAQPNSRFTAPAINCPCISSEFENPKGVPLSAMVFGGRRARTAPLVFESFDWAHGVFVGSAMASETTAAAAGQIGVVRRDPMAMLPFCGYNMGDYFAHWLRMGEVPDPGKLPKIFHVNWFKQDEQGAFIWPGFGENLRVLEWILARCAGEIGAEDTPIGRLPRPEDLNLEGLSLEPEALKALLQVDEALWRQEVEGVAAFYDKFDRLPEELRRQLEALKRRLG